LLLTDTHGLVMPSRSGNVLAIECSASEIYHLSTSRKFTRPSTRGMTRKRQQTRENILAEPMHALPRRKFNRGANDPGSMARCDAPQRVEPCERAGAVTVREVRPAQQKSR